MCCVAIFTLGGVVGLSSCGSSAAGGANATQPGASNNAAIERAVTVDFKQFMRAVSTRDVATTCRLSFPRGEQLFTAASLRRIAVSRAHSRWVTACTESRLFVAPKGAKPPGTITISGLVIRGDLATARVTGQIATVQTPGQPEQPTQFVHLGGRWLTTIPIPKPG